LPTNAEQVALNKIKEATDNYTWYVPTAVWKYELRIRSTPILWKLVGSGASGRLHPDAGHMTRFSASAMQWRTAEPSSPNFQRIGVDLILNSYFQTAVGTYHV
jgi:hypothetical protein